MVSTSTRRPGFTYDFFGDPTVRYMHVNSSDREALFLDPYRNNLILVFDRFGVPRADAYGIVKQCFQMVPAMQTNLHLLLRRAEGVTVILYYYGDQQPPVVSIFMNMPAVMFVSFHKGEFRNMAPAQIRNSILANLDAKNHILGSKESRISLMFENGWRQI